MGREWMYLDELNFPKKCPNCGGNVFLVFGAKKIIYADTYMVADKGIEQLDSRPEEIEWEVAYNIECADCGAELNKEGFKNNFFPFLC